MRGRGKQCPLPIEITRYQLANLSKLRLLFYLQFLFAERGSSVARATIVHYIHAAGTRGNDAEAVGARSRRCHYLSLLVRHDVELHCQLFRLFHVERLQDRALLDSLAVRLFRFLETWEKGKACVEVRRLHHQQLRVFFEGHNACSDRKSVAQAHIAEVIVGLELPNLVETIARFWVRASD
jgi:hypothetical protein